MKKLFKNSVAILLALSIISTPVTTFAENADSNTTVHTQSIKDMRIVPGERFYYTESGHVDLRIGQERVLFLGSGGWWVCKVISFEHLFNVQQTTKGYYQAISRYR